jgi:hypothetical protein
LALALLINLDLNGQIRGRRGNTSAGPIHPAPYKGVVTFYGKLKKLTKKEILIESADNRELLTFRRNKATKFLDKDAEVKAADIDLESAVSVDAAEDVDLKLMAISLNASPPQRGGGEVKGK